MVSLNKLFFLLLWLAFRLPCFGQETNQPPANFDLLRSFTDSSFQELLAVKVISADDPVQIVIFAKDTSFAAVQKSMIHDLLLNQYQFDSIVSEKGSLFSGKRIFFRWVNWQITYLALKKKIWQRKRFERNLYADYFVEVSDVQQEKLLFSRHFQRHYRDVLRKKDIRLVETPAYACTAGKYFQQQGVWKKWLKPVFLFAISGTVIYLFYSMRTE